MARLAAEPRPGVARRHRASPARVQREVKRAIRRAGITKHGGRHTLRHEANKFLEVADVMPHGLIFKFALLRGMRPEEYLALQWSDVDFERATAQVRRALVRHKKSWSFEEPKTARSRRTVFSPAPLLQKLTAHPAL